jgi:hypothetical protein
MMPGSSNLYVTPEDIERVRQIDLLTFLREKDPTQLVHVSGNTYCTLEHDSLKINNGKWYWHSRGFGGVSALDYLIKVKGYPLPRAVEAILGKERLVSPAARQKARQDRGKLILPEKEENSDRVVGYLQRRGIHSSIISYCLESKTLYESEGHHNAVFVGYDKNRIPRYAMLRSIYGTYKAEVAGSNKRYSFRIAAEDNGKDLHVFESAIDLMSYASMIKYRGQDWKQDALLSLAGVFQVKRKGVLPIALKGFLEDYLEVKTIYLHLDNDQIGRAAAKGIIESLEGEYEILDQPPRYGKDVNDALRIWLRKTSTKQVVTQ